MNQPAQTALRTALYRLLRPLVRTMLRHGMAYGSFAEIARKAFVDESLSVLQRSGQRASISSVAAMSGLTRKEAKRLVSFDVDNGTESDLRHNRIVRVITRWSLEPRFTDETGAPRLLQMDGEDGFAALVKEYSGDVTPAALLSILESSGTATITDAGIRLENRSYLPTQTPAASLAILGTDIAELATSIDFNLNHQQGERVFQRKVSNAHIDRESLRAFRSLVNHRCQALLEEYDAWLDAHEINPPAEPLGTESTAESAYVSVGIYYFDATLHEENKP